MKILFIFCFLSFSHIGFSQVEFKSPITLNNITLQSEFIDRVITISVKDITIYTNIDSVTTDIHLLKIKDYSLNLDFNREEHIYKCSSIDNLYPTTLIFHKVNNEFTHITVFQPTLMGDSIEQFDFLLD